MTQIRQNVIQRLYNRLARMEPWERPAIFPTLAPMTDLQSRQLATCGFDLWALAACAHILTPAGQYAGPAGEAAMVRVFEALRVHEVMRAMTKPQTDGATHDGDQR